MAVNSIYMVTHSTKYWNKFPVWFRNRLIFAELEPVLSHTEKSFIASYDRQFSTINKINQKIKTSFVNLFKYFLISAESFLLYDAIKKTILKSFFLFSPFHLILTLWIFSLCYFIPFNVRFTTYLSSQVLDSYFYLHLNF